MIAGIKGLLIVFADRCNNSVASMCRCRLLLDALEGTSDKYQKAKSHLDGARNLYQLFIQDGLLRDELMAGALCLAHLEGTRRSSAFNEADFETFDERDIADLRQLMSLVGSRISGREKLVTLIQLLGRHTQMQTSLLMISL